MKNLIFIAATGGAADLFYKTEQIHTIFYGASGEMIVRIRSFADDSIIEQATVPVPGVFTDVLVTVAQLQQDERFYVTISRSTGGGSSTWQSGATTYPDPGYSSSLDVTVVAT